LKRSLRVGRDKVLVCHFVGQEEKPGKSSCSPYRLARLTRPAARKERGIAEKVQPARLFRGGLPMPCRRHLMVTHLPIGRQLLVPFCMCAGRVTQDIDRLPTT
jgi:hypothetical protein